jgi:HD-like signal output (HDOD) protein
MRTIASLIASDPTLSALVLRLVNSPLFGIRYAVTGVLQAVAMLGLERVRSMTTTAALRMLVRPAASSPALTRCWRHSVATALATQELAARTDFNRDTAYTAGLLHDIGCFAMLSCWPKEYSRLLDTCEPHELLAQELESLGVTHSHAGAFLLNNWGLPRELTAVALAHHEPACEGKARLLDLVTCGCRTADRIGFALTAKLAEGNDAEVDAKDFTFRVCEGVNRVECVLV